MKVQLIVVQGKPEGKMIPLVGPAFRIGRGETCHSRPNSEQVSREHAEFAVEGEKVTIKDLGSRNGTLVNGKAISEPYVLKDRDLVQVGPLTFAVSIQGAAAPASKSAPAPAAKPASPDDVNTDDIDSWLVSDAKSPTPERPSGVYGGDTITIAAFKEDKTPKPAAATPPPPAPAPAPAPPRVPAPAAAPAPARGSARAPAPAPAMDSDDVEYERLPEGDTQEEMPTLGDENEGDDDDDAPAEAAPEDFIDESNPFHVKKPKPEEAAKPGSGKQVFKDTSDAASEILRKMMERRRGSK